MQLKAVWNNLSPSIKLVFYFQTAKEERSWGGSKLGLEDYTQKGIAKRLRISVPMLSKLLAPLSESGQVREQRVRIPGLRRSPLAYSITDAGTALARGQMKQIQMQFPREIDLDGVDADAALTTFCRMLALDSKIAGIASEQTVTSRKEAVRTGGTGEPKAPRQGRPELVDLRDAIQISPNFVGRTRELAELNEFLTAGKARLFTIIGPAAMGKTSLVSRFVMNAMKSVSVAFHICREWDTLRNVLEPAAELLARMGRKRLQYFIRGELRPITVQDAAAILKNDLQGVSALLIFDDIQKLGFDYRPLLKLFITSIDDEEAGGAPGPQTIVKVVTTSREPIAGVFDHRELIIRELVQEMELKGLTENETRELLKKRGAESLPTDKIYQMTGGHPLYIELITKAGLSGAVRDFRKFVGNEIMGRLTPEERAVLGCLSVFRMPVPFKALQIPQATPEILDRLVRLGMVNETTPEEYYALDIVTDTLYRGLKSDEKRLYHSAAAKYLRGLKNEESCAEVIHHLLFAEEITGALEYASENVTTLIRLGHGSLMEQVLDESKTGDLPVRGIVAACKIRSEVALAKGEWRIALIHLDKALAAVKGDPLQEGRILAAEAEALREQGKMDEALDKFLAAEKVSKDVYDLQTIASVYRGIGNLYWKKGEMDNAMEFLKKSLDYLKAAEMGAEYGETLVDLGAVQHRMGNSDKAIEYFNRAVEELKKGGWIFPLARAYNNLGVEYLQRNEVKEAIRVWEKSLEMCKEANNKRGMIVILSNLSDPYSQINQFNRAIKSLDQALRIVNETDDDITKALVLSNYGQVYTKMQKWDKAKKYFEESLSIYEKSKNSYDFAMALFKYGKSLIAGNKIGEAIMKLTQAKELFLKCDAKTRVKEVEDLLHDLETTPQTG